MGNVEFIYGYRSVGKLSFSCSEYHLTKIYWSYSVIHVVHIINMLPTHILNDFSPHEMLYKTTTDFNQLKMFRSLCYFSTLPTNRKNFYPKASKYVFIGFKTWTKGYVLLNIQFREIFVSRDVVFYEHIFPYQKVEDTSNKMDSPNFFTKILLPKPNLFWVNHHKPFLYPLHPVIM